MAYAQDAAIQKLITLIKDALNEKQDSGNYLTDVDVQLEQISGGAVLTINGQSITLYNGANGFSPTFKVINNNNGVTVVLTDINGTQAFTVTDGVDGADGFSPLVTVTKNGSKITISVTDVNGTTSQTFTDSSAVESIIADTEESYVATRLYQSGDLVIIEDTLYHITDDIAIGSTIVPNENCVITTVAQEIASGGGGGGGTSDYTYLTHKPRINGVTLSGNKSASDLGLLNAPSSANVGDMIAYNGSAWVTTIPNYVTPELYGAIGDGVVDDTIAFQSALNSGYPVFASQTYLLSEVNVTQDTILICTPDTKIIKKTGSSENKSGIIQVSGIVEDETALSQSAVTYAQTVTVSDASIFSIGDCVELANGGTGEVTNKHLITRVRKISGNVLTLAHELNWDYDASTAVVRLLSTAKILAYGNGATIDGNNISSRRYGFWLNYNVGSVIDGFNVENSATGIVRLDRSLDCLISNSVGKDPITVSIPYGEFCSIAYSTNVQAKSLQTYGYRRSVDYIGSYLCSAYACSAQYGGFTSHGLLARKCSFVNCVSTLERASTTPSNAVGNETYYYDKDISFISCKFFGSNRQIQILRDCNAIINGCEFNTELENGNGSCIYAGSPRTGAYVQNSVFIGKGYAVSAYNGDSTSLGSVELHNCTIDMTYSNNAKPALMGSSYNILRIYDCVIRGTALACATKIEAYNCIFDNIPNASAYGSSVIQIKVTSDSILYNCKFNNNQAVAVTGNPSTIKGVAQNQSLLDVSTSIVAVQSGSGDPSPDNIRTISGYTGMTLYYSDEDISNPSSVVVDWSQDAGSVYGGKYDLTTGVLTINKRLQVFDTSTVSTWGSGSVSISLSSANRGDYSSRSSMICNQQSQIVTSSATSGIQLSSDGYTLTVYDSVNLADEATARAWLTSNPIQVVYPLLNATVVTGLTTSDIKTFLNENNLWSTCGNVTVWYAMTTDWYDHYIPSGGLADEALAKNSNSDFDVTWVKFIKSPSNPSNGAFLTYNSSNSAWEATTIAVYNGGSY